MLQARENARARALDSAFDPTDTRWTLAIETQRALQGAVLAYEDRKRLLGLATKLGIRAFDANLIVAVVQDRARRGESLEDAAPTIAMVAPARTTEAAARCNGPRLVRTETDTDPAAVASRETARSRARARIASAAVAANDQACDAASDERASSAWPWVTGMIIAIAIDAVLIGWLMFG
ncbi:MAG: hypothetical protein LW806_04755 [Planctomycetaceae bacterium]|nr:hypothetical protein [Planctomycetaceae bacterium]